MPRKKKSGLHAASTLLPLVIGLASGGLPTPGPEPIQATAFKPSCTVAFDPIAKHHPMDDSCGPTGNASDTTSAQALQNLAKNNFCAPGPVVNVGFDVLHQLQRDADADDVMGGKRILPKDRSILRGLSTTIGPIGERALVRLAAFVIDAHYSNHKSGGESVNCKHNGEENNDIHIVLGEKSNDEDPCDSVTAEMSPHLRPDVWDPDTINHFNAHKYRFTGQLFYDAAPHSPCAPGKRTSPPRSSLWEVHPVYAVDICIDPGNNCKVDNDLNWVPFSDFAGTENKEPAEDTGGGNE